MRNRSRLILVLALAACSTPALAALSVTGTPPAATFNSAYTWTPAISGGNGQQQQCAYQGGDLVGLAVNGTTCQVTGTPLKVGTISGILHVMDTATEAYYSFSITVSPAAALSISGTPGVLVARLPYAFTPTISGGTGYTRVTRSGYIPTSLNLDPVTGALSGTIQLVTRSTYATTLTVTDSTGATASLPITIPAYNPLHIYGAPKTALYTKTYSFTPTTSDGYGTKTFAWSGSTLANYGLSFDTTTGTISGTVLSVPGPVSGVISVTDSSRTTSMQVNFAVRASLPNPRKD